MEQENTNFEINLLPVISLLAVLISFLLLTAVWVNLGSMDVSQGLGSETQDQTENKPSLWAQFESDGSLTLMVKDLPEEVNMREARFSGEKMWNDLGVTLEDFKANYPEINTALVLPKPNSPYSNVIKTLDVFKKSGWENLGIAPL